MKELLSEGIPVYSANVFEPVGMIQKSNVKRFDYPSILWGIDGNFEMRNIPAGRPFATTDHCGTIQILNENIVPEYLLYALTLRKEEESFDRSFRASLANISTFTIRMPIKEDGNFDVKIQQELATRFVDEQQRKQQLLHIKSKLDELFPNYLT